MFRGMAFTNIYKEPIGHRMPLEIPQNVLTELTREQFAQLQANNPGTIIIKFGAEWCGPCKRIDPLVYDWMGKLPPTVQGAIIDIDESFDLYALLKSKRMVNGVPVILAYRKGTVGYVPDDMVVGADENQVNAFFTRVLQAQGNYGSP